MRLVTVRTRAGTTAARLEGEELVELPFRDVGELLREPDWEALAGAEGDRSPVAEADLAPVVPAPAKIVCLGLNYRSHIEEMGRELPSHPTLFAKYARSLIGPRDPIVLPPESDQVDWEVELAFVVGRAVRRARGREAASAIAGFCVLNDVSMRDWQFRTLQFLQGKTFERSTPLGPALVTPDEVPGGATPDVELRCDVDGDVMQRARTSDLLFPPPDLVEYISTIVTLEPGDLVATGTPSGVGSARNPPVYLRPGQTVRSVVEGVGELLNVCVAEDADVP